MVNPKVIKEQDKFEDYLQEAGLRVSRGRRVVFEEVMDSHGHFTSEEIAKTCRDRDATVSRATVYRSLREMVEAGVIRKTAFGKKHQVYEHLYDEKKHHHARCVRCHALIEIPDLDEEKPYHPILKKKGFRILGHEMHFYGICQKCQNLSKKK